MFVETLHMDNESKNIRRIMPGTSTLNTTAEDEHIPEIERHIMKKECARSI